MRILKWIVDRVGGRVQASETLIGGAPRYEDIVWDGLNFSRERFDELEPLDREQWKREVIGHEEMFVSLHDHLPPEITYERELLICRLQLCDGNVYSIPPFDALSTVS